MPRTSEPRQLRAEETAGEQRQKDEEMRGRGPEQAVADEEGGADHGAYLQRQALRRLIVAFATAGIRFAVPNFTMQLANTPA